MISRRQFLQLGSLTALSAPLAWHPRTSAADLLDAHSTPMPVGYWDPAAAPTGPILTHRRRSERRARRDHDGLAPGDAFRPDVRAAGRAAGGEELAGAAAVTVHGVMTARSPWVGPRLEALSLDLLFAAAGSDLACAAWQYRRSPAGSAAAPVTMRVPLDAGALRLALHGRRAERRPAGRLLASLLGRPAAVESRRHEVRLSAPRAGVYFLPWLRPGEPTPRWSDYQFRAVPALDGARLLVRRGPLGLEAPSFDYLVVAIDRAPADARLAS